MMLSPSVVTRVEGCFAPLFVAGEAIEARHSTNFATLGCSSAGWAKSAKYLCDCPVHHVRFVLGIVRHIDLNLILALPVKQPSARVVFIATRLLVPPDNH
jgi:hypothetical protein